MALCNALFKSLRGRAEASSLKEEIPLTAKRENVERAMENPRAIVHAETQHEVALMTEETGLLEELPYECPSPCDHHSDDQLATCSWRTSRLRQSELHVLAAPIRTRELSSRLTGQRRILGLFGASR